MRKSKATHDLADGVPYIENRGSWAKGSKALRDVYLFVSQQDKDNAYRRKYNMATKNTSVATVSLEGGQREQPQQVHVEARALHRAHQVAV